MLRGGSGSKDRVMVVLRRPEEGVSGHRRDVSYARIMVRGRWSELSSSDVETLAADNERGVLHSRRFTCGRFPGDDLSRVIDAEGVEWEVVGEPRRHRGSSRTSRDVVTLRQLGVLRGVRADENR